MKTILKMICKINEDTIVFDAILKSVIDLSAWEWHNSWSIFVIIVKSIKLYRFTAHQILFCVGR